MSDTPIEKPVTRSDMVKAFIGDLARPFAIYATSLSASVASIIVAMKVENGNDGAIALGAISALVVGIYIGKSWEVAKTAQAATDK